MSRRRREQREATNSAESSADTPRDARDSGSADRRSSDRRSRQGDSHSSDAQPRHSKRKRLVVLTLVSLAIVGAILAWVAFRPSPWPPLDPPHPDLAQASPPVAQIVKAASDEVRQAPESAAAWGQLGMVFFAHQFEAEATTCFERAALLDPRDYRWPYLWGLNIGVVDPAQAERCFRQALQLRPNEAVIHTRLGELLLTQQRGDEAAAEFDLALQFAPRDVRAMLGRARVELARGNIAPGLEWAERAASAAPSVKDVHETLAQLHQRAGHRAEARRALARAEEGQAAELLWNDPLSAEVLELRRDMNWYLIQADQLTAAGQLEQAANLLRGAIDTDDRDPQVYTSLAKILIQAQRFPDAQAVLRRAAERHPNSAEVCFQQGTVDFLTGRVPEARQQFARAVARKPDYALAHYNLGHACLKLGDRDAALEAFENAVRFRPYYADAHINASRLLLESGRTREAREHLKVALELAPDNPVARQLLRQLDGPAPAPDAKK